MPSISLKFVGFALLQEAMESIINAAEQDQKRGDWYVVSVVRYAEILEWKTPHWRVAINSLANDVDLDVSQQFDMLNAMIAGGSLRKEIAIRLLRKIKRLIQQNGLVDSGNYLASVAMGPSRDAALATSMSNLIDPSTSILVEI